MYELTIAILMGKLSQQHSISRIKEEERSKHLLSILV